MNNRFKNSGLTSRIERELTKPGIDIHTVDQIPFDNCHESFISEDISRKLLETVNTEVKKGVEVEVLHYAA